MSREITPRVLVLGLVLSVVMGAANVYVGLKVGMTVSASIPAAAVAMLVFRSLFKTRSILEANQVQTAASAGESLAAGIIFTMPALVMMEGVWTHFDFWTVTLVSIAGGVLGILFMIPMRKVFVVDNDELPYPEGIACAAVLEAGSAEDADPRGARALLMGGLIGGVLKFLESFMALARESLAGVWPGASRVHYYGADVSPMLVAVGFIVRLNVAVLIFIGGAIGWLVAMPLLGLPAGVTEPTVGAAIQLWKSDVRFLGVGAMVVGGAVSIWSVRGGLVRAVSELKQGLSGANRDAADRDLAPGLIATLGLICILLTGYVYYHFTGHLPITILSTVVMIVMAFFFTAVACYIVGLVGNSNSPVSGMTITTVLFTGAMFMLFGFQGTEGKVAIIGVAAVVCCVACTAGDVCNDLKTGSLVGSSPAAQQVMQILGVVVAAFIMAPILNLLNSQLEFGTAELPAAQATLFKSLAEGLMGEGQINWPMVGIGAAIGVAVLLGDQILRARQSSFRLHLMPVAVGIYLPFGIATPILLGGILAHWMGRGSRDPQHEEERLQRGVLFSSGVIAGEALTKIVLVAFAAKGIEHFPWQRFFGWSPSPALLTTVTWGFAVLTLLAFLRWARPMDER